MGNSVIIVGDIIKSTAWSGTDDWRRFGESIDRINQTCSEDLDIPLAIYGGDSFGAKIKTVGGAIRVIIQLMENLLPLQSRIVLVEGEVSYGLEKRSFLQMGGSALWKSEKLMTDLKKSKQYVSASLDDSERSKLITHVLNLISALKTHWTARQKEVVSAREGSGSQKDAAKKLGVTPQYISQQLIDAQIKTIRAGENYLLGLFK